MKPLIIAIDGPSGAGKGTVARAVAGRLAYRHVDTGAMYRGVAWKAHNEGLPLDDEDAVTELAGRAVFELEGGVRIDGHDIARAIRTPEIDSAAARVARLPKVREVLVARQRELGRAGGIVMEGRDIGTVVFPDADVKIYLDASADERARRRALDPAHAGGGAQAVGTIASALDARDRSDRTRTVSPLAMAPDAVFLDTTHLSVDEAVEAVLDLVERRKKAAAADGGPPR